MTTPDDLDRGMYIALTGDKGDEEIDPFLDGEPLRVMAVSLPFIAVSDGDVTFAIDNRQVTYQKLTKEYVRAMRGGSYRRRECCPPSAVAAATPYDCPRCGRRLRRRKTGSDPNWKLHCQDCGFERNDI
jgi:predicted RNA-binding Zn-ribbon protein involved in translation (DUF1610 family)